MATYILNNDFRINSKRFYDVNEAVIITTRKDISDTAVIKLPKTALLRRGKEITSVEVAKQFNVGDQVVLKSGYKPTLRTEFVGYVKEIKTSIPLEIHCEDSMYLLRNKNLKKSFKNVRLLALLEFVLDGKLKLTDKTKVPNIRFDEFYIKNQSAPQVLQKLSETYGLRIYLSSQDKLYVGWQNEENRASGTYSIGNNTFPDPSLDYQNESSVRLQVEAKWIKSDNTTESVTVGDADGEKRTLHFYEVENLKQLKELAESKLKDLKYTGYRGNVTGFAEPYLQHSGSLKIINDNFPEQTSTYLIESVTTTIGTGIRRECELGIKL